VTTCNIVYDDDMNSVSVTPKTAVNGEFRAPVLHHIVKH